MQGERGVRGYVARHHLGLIALFVALSGTGYAATQVSSDDIERDAVRSRHIDNGQVRSADVQDGGLGGADIDETSLREVPFAAEAGRAGTATSANSASTASRALEADSAGLLDGLDSSEFLRRAESVNADRLDGLDSSAFVEQGDAIDAATLGGKPASSFFQGVAHRGGALPSPGTSGQIDLGDLRVSFACPNAVNDPSTITLRNLSQSTMIVAALASGSGADVFQLQPSGQAGDTHNNATSGPEDMTIYEVVFSKQGITYDGQLIVTTNHVGTRCDVGARLVLFAFS
jgi:hypothetical protein